MGLIGTLLAGGTGWFLSPSQDTPRPDDAPRTANAEHLAMPPQTEVDRDRSDQPADPAATPPASPALAASGALGVAALAALANPPSDVTAAPTQPGATALDFPPPAASNGQASPNATDRDPPADELERCRAQLAQTPPAVGAQPSVPIVDQSAAPAKPRQAASKAKRKSVKAKRAKSRSKTQKPRRISAPKSFWSSRQGGHFLGD